jgi:hypothetical protein
VLLIVVHALPECLDFGRDGIGGFPLLLHV